MRVVKGLERLAAHPPSALRGKHHLVTERFDPGTDQGIEMVRRGLIPPGFPHGRQRPVKQLQSPQAQEGRSVHHLSVPPVQEEVVRGHPLRQRPSLGRAEEPVRDVQEVGFGASGRRENRLGEPATVVRVGPRVGPLEVCGTDPKPDLVRGVDDGLQRCDPLSEAAAVSPRDEARNHLGRV